MKALVASRSLVAGCGAGGTPRRTDASGGLTQRRGPAGCSVVIAFMPMHPVADAATPMRARPRCSQRLRRARRTAGSVTPDGGRPRSTRPRPDNSADRLPRRRPRRRTPSRVHVAASRSARQPVADSTSAARRNSRRTAAARHAAALDGAPPHETTMQVQGGARCRGARRARSGTRRDAGRSVNGATGVQAYLRFMPVSAPNASSRCSPTRPALLDAPARPEPQRARHADRAGHRAGRAAWTVVDDDARRRRGQRGQRHRAGSAAAPRSRARQIQLDHDGVPSTLATTAADGCFTLRRSLPAVGCSTVEVTPPDATRPAARCRATQSSTSASRSRSVTAASRSEPRRHADQARLGSSARANAQLMVVGSLASAGTVGGATAAATSRGSPRPPTRSGALPTTLVPPRRCRR